jgi:two-component system, sporulation sensor kinase D
MSLQGNSVLTVQKVAIQQVLSNLINNSIDVLSSVTYPKVIKIHTYEDETNYYIDVVDNGTGIPQELQDIKPLFTTDAEKENYHSFITELDEFFQYDI